MSSMKPYNGSENESCLKVSPPVATGPNRPVVNSSDCAAPPPNNPHSEDVVEEFMVRGEEKSGAGVISCR